jgi:hypothetical protein
VTPSRTLLVVWVVVPLGCTGNLCSTPSDCSGSLVCAPTFSSPSRCRAGCDADSSCPEGLVCVSTYEDHVPAEGLPKVCVDPHDPAWVRRGARGFRTDRAPEPAGPPVLIIAQGDPVAPIYELRIHPEGLVMLTGSDAVRGRGHRWRSVDASTVRDLEARVCSATSHEEQLSQADSEQVLLRGPRCSPPVLLRYRRYADDAQSTRAQELTERILNVVGAFPLTLRISND